jgi:hypothetical protein
MFENSVLGTIFGHEREDVTGGWIKLNSEENILYSSPNVIGIIWSGRVGWVGHVECKEETTNFSKKISKEETHGWHMLRWQGDNEIDFKETEFEEVEQ